MDGFEGFNNIKKKISDVFSIDHDRIEKLRQILEVEQKRNISYKEADEVGRELINLFECLAGDRRIIPNKEEEER